MNFINLNYSFVSDNMQISTAPPNHQRPKGRIGISGDKEVVMVSQNTKPCLKSKISFTSV